MAKIYSLLATLIARLRTNDCLPDPVAMLSPRDWADLPTYHPAERWDGCPRQGCSAG